MASWTNRQLNGVPRIGYMKGGEKAKWSDIDMADKFLDEAKNILIKLKTVLSFIYTLQQPHVPRTPHPRFEDPQEWDLEVT